MLRSEKTVPASTPGFLALSCIGFLATAPAHAQNAEPAQADGGPHLGGMVVTDTTADTGYKVERAQSPKAVAPLLDTPRSITVIDSQVIKDTGSVNLVDALRTVPGITFGAAEGGNPIGDRPFIRGFDSQGSIFLDGVRDLGSQTRETFAVDQVQVVRGSDSTLGGRGSAGGAINIISKLPKNVNAAEADISICNAAYKRATADINWVLAPHVAFRIEGMWHHQDVAERDAIFQHRWGVAPSLTVGLDTPTRLTIAYYHMQSHELPDSGIPYLYTLANAPLGTTRDEPALGNVTTAGGQTGHVSRRTFYGLKDRDFRDAKTDQASLRLEHDFGTLTLRNTSRFDHSYQAYSYTLPDDSQGNVFGTTATNSGANLTDGGYVWRRSNNRYGYTNSIVNQTDLYGTFDTGGIKHSIAAGVELSWEKARRGTFNFATGSTINPRCNTDTVARYYCTSLFDPNPSDPWVNYTSDSSNVVAPVVKNSPLTETQNEARNAGIYGFDSITLTDRLILNLGIRWDSFTTELTPGLPVGAAGPQFTYKRNDKIFDYQAGLVFKPTPETSVYASYATASTPPNSLLGEGREANGLPTTAATANVLDLLKVERTKSYEVGAKANLFHEALALTLAVFQTDTANARVTGDDGNPQFIGKTRTRGVEVGFNGNITDQWTVFGGYSYLDSKIRDGGFTSLAVAANGPAAATTLLVPSVSNGRQTPQVAKNSFTLWTNYKVKGFTIGGGAFYMSRQYGGYQDNRSASQDAAGVITLNPATKLVARSVPGYWRFDARAGYDFNEHLSVSVNAQNLTNKTYFSQVYATHYATLAAGRTVFGTVTVKY